MKKVINIINYNYNLNNNSKYLKVLKNLNHLMLVFLNIINNYLIH